ncbi:Aldehyde dehydrogenase A [Bosea sp. 62]|uniref:aldehyde dehydrogenase family protein n=1 Tax=unclassified Bosea (in: a-proteobacteria) TaxID=2653178 RepID=UPI001252910F|nr:MULTISPECIES: aldehyde dehydrogenase family protein [unclassified Bosea (in: a-proteobacteria)]CAD5251823.1 Aldehyde dehydrogenase A [Bosea sp. 21B]CAD5261386.1 Aldehyde dehydrogenase A [Bosea sp. 7B]CAD5273309.1 Aldehyde dehydrogenase A [Bosea sp. 46]VVT43442.1 Aldehyde dehydrogenase A [Bosea sp. EC-HK365B]VXB26800.1 Aldehyde dehydrogenase A [Bosea sp. 29B]
MTQLPHALNWIDGEWSDSPIKASSVDPATGGTIGSFADATLGDAERAVAAARRAFLHSPWRDDRRLRARVLNAIADRIEARADELAQILATENGKILPEARFEVATVPSKLRYCAALALAQHGRALAVRPNAYSMVLHEPVGVAGLIVPWNSPVVLLMRSLGPALAAGTTVVAKMPGQTAQVNAFIARILSEIPELPAGVVNIFSESGIAGSAFLVEAPDVPVISFTGSTRTGRAIAAAGAARLKRFGLELGGKTPMIVFDDADIEAALPVLEKAVTVFAGQFCMAGSRILAERGIADRLRQALAERLAKVRLGPASDPASEMGPLIDQQSVARINAVVEKALAEGARAIVRGGPANDPALAAGAFYRPTLLEVSSPELAIVQEEVFGPVATFQVFEGEAAAIALANNSDFGLAASIWSRNPDRQLRLARALQVGTVWINDWAAIHDEFEEGGFKQSGLGRLNGLASLHDFQEVKHIALKATELLPVLS